MRFTRIAIAAAVAAPLLITGLARAQEKPAGNEEKKPALSEPEMQAMAVLHHANTMEMDLGKLATERAKSPEVKSYGQRMIRDHKKADTKLAALAKKQGVVLAPPTPKNDAEKREMDEETATMNKLRQLEGDAFDREYIATMVTGHAKVLQVVSETRAQAKDPGLTAFLKEVQPVVEQHRTAAEKLATKLNEQPSTDQKPGQPK